MQRRSFTTLLGTAAWVLSVFTSPAHAAWPDGKTLNIVVPYAPGGTADALARLISQHLGPKLGTTVVVVNKADLKPSAKEMLPILQSVGELLPDAEVVPVSARTGRNVPELLKVSIVAVIVYWLKKAYDATQGKRQTKATPPAAG